MTLVGFTILTLDFSVRLVGKVIERDRGKLFGAMLKFSIPESTHAQDSIAPLW